MERKKLEKNWKHIHGASYKPIYLVNYFNLLIIEGQERFCLYNHKIIYNDYGVVIKLYFSPYEYYRQGGYLVPMKITKSEVDLRNNIRMLWEQHGAWTRMVIMSIVFGLPDEEVATNRLLRNPVDFANLLKFFYGNKNALKFSDLLKDHLVIAAQLVKAAKAGDNKSAAQAEKKWYENADELATFLSYINPYWSKESWRSMLHEHLRLVKAEAVAMLTKDYAAGIKVYDNIESQALEMADMMAAGIIKQFPFKFTI